MPRLVTFEADEMTAMRAFELITFILLDNIFLALEIGAPNCIRVFVDLARETNSLQKSILFFIQQRDYDFFA